MGDKNCQLNHAFDLARGVAALANRLGLLPPVFRNWAAGKRPVSVLRCVEIEELTGGWLLDSNFGQMTGIRFGLSYEG